MEYVPICTLYNIVQMCIVYEPVCMVFILLTKLLLIYFLEPFVCIVPPLNQFSGLPKLQSMQLGLLTPCATEATLSPSVRQLRFGTSHGPQL